MAEPPAEPVDSTTPSGRELLLRAARGEPTPRPPVWVMRGAGRYLPGYRALRADHSFQEAVRTPEVAARATLLPYERFDPDAVILFADVLGVARALGFSYRIESGVGPVVDDPIEDPTDVPTETRPIREVCGYAGETVARVADELDDTGVIGYAGGPFTVATYLLGAASARSKMGLRRFRTEHPDAFRRLLDRLSTAIGESLAMQADRGADVVQLFDTRAAFLSPQAYREWLLPCYRTIFRAVDVPTILFSRYPGGHLDALADSGADVLSLDWTVDLERARAQLGEYPVQGNLDPAVLFGDHETIRERTRAAIRAGGQAGYVCNLGHGVHRDTPPAAVERFVDTVKRWSWG